MLDVGLTATLKTNSLPLLIPPLIPPELLVLVVPFALIIISLLSEPFIFADSKPEPNSIPLIAGIEKTI